MSDDNKPSDDIATTHTPPGTTVIPGRWVVMGMFAFGGVLVVMMAIYWHLHTSPFIELQEALAREFEGSRPRVQGGQHKMHQNTPRILRIVMKVDFDPTTDNENAKQVEQQVAALAKKHHDLTTYKTLEIHLFHPIPEKEIKQRSVEIPISEVLGKSL